MHRMNVGALVSLLFLALLVLAACGPKKSDPESAQLEVETVRIAQEFAQDGDTDRARGRLQDLDVANPMQWLVYTAETALSEDPDAVETRALSELAVRLGSQSHLILDYAVQAGIISAKEQQAESAEPQVVQESAPAPVEATKEAPATAPPVAPPTVAVILLEPTTTPELVAESPAPTATAISVPRAVASTSMNVRSGPGTAYSIVQAMGSGEGAEIVAKNAQSDWWQVRLGGEQLGWVFGQLVQTSGDVASIAVAANIPEPPPTLTPAPVVEPPPAEEKPPEGDTPPPASSGPDFRVIEKRLWDVYENGGSLNGPSVTCGEKRQLVVNVVDANGVRLNGVAVQVEFGAKEIFVTGAQGKGEGVSEFILGEGQDVKVIRDTDGRDVSSEVARGMVTKPAGIPYETLMAARYCIDDMTCKSFVDAPGCYGHYSWTVTFQRNY